MANRFGRNKKRKLQEQLNTYTSFAKFADQQIKNLNYKIVEMKRDHEKEILQARTARDCIKIDVDTLIDDRERNLNIRVKFDNMAKNVESLYVSNNIDLDYMECSRIEEDIFVKLAAEKIARYALDVIMQKWRSRGYNSPRY
jgi:uncharacterized protein YfcZ (UPF0381/DUF406 family)